MHIDNAVLLSDVHLGAEHPQITNRFLHCLQHDLLGSEHLFILGDLFEAWIGDDATDAIADRIKPALSALAEQGLKIWFMHGNRDFLLGERYADAAGMRLLPDPCFVTSGQRRLLLAHGDAWCTDDLPYQALRQQVRDPQWQAGFLALPIDQRLAMARQARAASSAHTSTAADEIMDVNPQAIADVFSTHAVDAIIHGHTHRPADHCHGEQRRHVLGDWYQHSSWLRLQHGRIVRHGNTI